MDAKSKDAKIIDADGLKFQSVGQGTLKVGDIVRIRDGQYMPADCILLSVEDDQKECLIDNVAHKGFY